MIGAVKKGHFVGRAPIGYDKVDKKLVINDIESEVIRRIFDLYIDIASSAFLNISVNCNEASAKFPTSVKDTFFISNCFS